MKMVSANPDPLSKTRLPLVVEVEVAPAADELVSGGDWHDFRLAEVHIVLLDQGVALAVALALLR